MIVRGSVDYKSQRRYSENLQANRRGSNSFPEERVRKLAERDAKILKYCPKLWPVLDVGCGEGYHVEAYMRSGIPCVGIDVDPRQLKAGRERMRQYRLKPKLYQRDARHTRFRSESFGSVRSYGMLMMTPFVSKMLYGRILTTEETRVEVKKILSEMRRVVRRRGVIRIITFSDKELMEPEYYKPRPLELARLATEVGLKVLHMGYLRSHPTVIDATFKKPETE